MLIGKTLCQTLVIAGVMATPTMAFAQDRTDDDGSGWYVTLSGSLSMLQDVKSRTTGLPVAPGFVEVEASPDAGLGAQLAFGRRFGSFRLEGETGYSRNRADGYTAIVPATGFIDGTIRDDSWRVMVNGYVDLKRGPVTPFIGGGIGAARVSARVVAPPAFTPAAPPITLIDDKVSNFAYQLMGGVNVRLSDRLSLQGQYRWFDAGTLEGRDFGGRPFARNHSGHNIDIGVRLAL